MRMLIVPTHRESEAVRRALPGLHPLPGWEVPAWQAGELLVIEPGMGPGRTAALLPRLAELSPEAVWLYGWCGGLVQDLDVGDLVLADATVYGDGAGTEFAYSSASPPPGAILSHVRRLAQELEVRLAIGPVLTSDRVLATVAEKRAGAATGAVAVEMEAGPLARWTAARGVPFVHLRVVLDPLRSALPSERLHGDGGEDGSGRKPRFGERAYLLRALVRPRTWPAVWRLFRQIPIAVRAMTAVIAALARPGGPLAPG